VLSFFFTGTPLHIDGFFIQLEVVLKEHTFNDLEMIM